MRIEQSKDYSINNKPLSDMNATKDRESGVKKSSDGSVNVSGKDLNLGQEMVEEKRNKARGMAMSLMKNVFSRDQKMDEQLRERNDHVDRLIKDNDECNEKIKDISKEKDNLKEMYGITEDSTEEEELKLVKKMSGKGLLKGYTEEEIEEYRGIMKRGLSDYQQQMLELDSMEAEFRKRITENQKGIIEDNAVIEGMKIERLKSHDMDDAVKQGEKLMDAAGREIKGMLVEEAVDNMEAEFEEKLADAAKKKEEKEKLEERIEKAKNNDVHKDDSQEEIYEMENLLDEVKIKASKSQNMDAAQSLSMMVSELELTAEDVKGIVFDTEA